MTTYNTGNALPSSAAKDLYDNAEALDEIVNSGQDAVTGRLGKVLRTWQGMQNENDSIIEDTRQNLIPLSRQYMTLPAAQADIANIPEGSSTYVRNSDGGTALADEYINMSGTLTPTGRQMPSNVIVSETSVLLKDEITTRKGVIIPLRSSPGYYFFVDDANGREVFGLDSINGAPTDYTMSVWFGKMAQSKSLPVIRNIPGYGLVYILPDSDGEERLTELAIQSSDGKFPDWVLNRWADRLAPMLEGKIDVSSHRPTLAGLWEHPSGDLVPYNIDLRKIVGLGSSSTNRSNDTYSTMASEFGVSYVNLGDEGASIQQNAAQIGAIPALLTVAGNTIPASGAVNVTASNMPLNSNMNSFSGTLAGIPGVFAWSTGSTGTFTRTTAGNAVSVSANTPFIPDYRQYRANMIILESGKNDINTGRSSSLILADTEEIASWFAPYVPSTVVMGHFANGNYSTTARTILSDVNAGIKNTFGNRSIDQQAWLTSAQLWTDLANEGITPTAQDYADQANGDVPQSLMIASRDHLTPIAYGYRMKYLVKPKLIELGLYKE